jgi:hypothetical protein
VIAVGLGAGSAVDPFGPIGDCDGRTVSTRVNVCYLLKSSDSMKVVISWRFVRVFGLPCRLRVAKMRGWKCHVRVAAGD